MDLKTKKQIIKILEEEKDIPVSFKDVLFPEEDKKMEYELVYGIKQREEDILADTWSVPFQPVKQFGDIKKDEWVNKLIFGDNLQALKHLLKLKEQGKLKNADGTDGIRLIYIDPPFGTGDIYDARSGAPAYSAKLQGAAFIEFVRKRLIFLRELLTDDGSIYVRIDYHFGHYVKVIMDEVFGKNNFINEIVISRSARPTEAKGMYHTTHDVLFFYSKSPNYFFKNFEVKRVERNWRGMHLPGIRWTKIDKKYLKLFKKDVREKNGEYYSRARIFFGKEILPPEGRHWAINQENIFKLEKDGDIKLDDKGRPISIESETQKIGDDWTDIQGYTRYWGYPTENSEELLERVIQGSSQINDIILDCFAGSGTTGAIAEKLRRRWIMADVSKFSIYTIIKRMLSLKEGVGQKGKDIKPKPFMLYNAGLYFNGNHLKGLDGNEYSNFALELFQAEKKEQIINGFKTEGVLMNAPVHIFPRDGALTEEYIDNLHETLGDYLKGKMFIIVPLNRVYFLQDYIEKDGVRYYILRIPYSIIDELHKNQFSRPIQAVRIDDINKLIEAIGFDFIYPPNVETNCYKIRLGLFDEMVIDIKKIEAVQRAKKPIEFKDNESLSMVMIDKDYNGKYFDMDYFFFQDEIKKNDWKVRFPVDKLGEKIAIIYLDVLGNERFEVKNIKDFKNKK